MRRASTGPIDPCAGRYSLHHLMVDSSRDRADPSCPPSVSGMGRILLTSVLWVLAIVGVAGNVVASLDDMGTPIQLSFGIIAVLSVAGLVALYVRDRRARQS
jgi:hypothetical protein